MEIKVRGVKLYRSHGKLYAYHRKSNTRIRAPIGSAAFLAQVELLDSKVPPDPQPGTLGVLVAAYRDSPEFLQLAERTRRYYQKIFDYLKPLDGDPLVTINSAYVIEVRDAAFQAHKRRFANYVLSVLRLLLKWGSVRDFVETNQAAAVPKIRRPRSMPPANRPWTDAEYETVIAAAKGGVRIAIALGRFTGIPEGDMVRLPRSAYDGQWIRWRRGKTGNPIDLPTHPDLKTILDDERQAARIEAMTMVAGVKGRPYTENGFRTMFFRLVKSLEEEGLVGPGLTFQGLRTTAATALAEAGCSTQTIMAVTGHTTEAMVSHYTRQANRRKQAVVAVAKLRGPVEVSKRRDKAV
jgi:integrase